MRLLYILLLLAFSSNSLAEEKSGKLKIKKLQQGIYLHTSYQKVEGWGLVGANGLVVLDKDQAYIIDTPWTDADSEKLVNWLQDQGYTIAGVIATHHHDDTAGGIDYFNSIGVNTYASSLTNKLLKDKGKSAAKLGFTEEVFTILADKIEAYYPGAGHAQDNIVIWLAESQTLFGGCFVKSLSSKSLGYLGNASVERWAQSIDKVLAKYPEIKVTVPGHGRHGTKELLAHTRHLVKQKIAKAE